MTPLGTPASWKIRVKYIPVILPCVAGLNTTEFPAIIAGAILDAAKFKG